MTPTRPSLRSQRHQSGQKEFELLKSEFLANISHELRTPLNIMIGHVSLLLDGVMGKLDDEARSGLTKAMSASYHMLTLVNNLVDLACLAAGVVEIKKQVIDLRGLLDERATKSGALIKDRPVVLIKEISPLLPRIETDKNKLEKILGNLLDNAVKFTAEGQIVLRAYPRSGAVEITVTDTGIGISRETQQTIFEDFRQADSSETRAYQGMGLGLGVSKKLVSLLGGRMEVESEVGKGSTFRVILPREIPHASKSSDC